VARIGHKSDGRVTWRFAFNASAPVLPGFTAARLFQL
jgi:protein-L-isoaspartate(D-aspartate) O-methyltransferase